MVPRAYGRGLSVWRCRKLETAVSEGCREARLAFVQPGVARWGYRSPPSSGTGGAFFLTGHGLFAASEHTPRHETLIDPLLFAQQLIRERNARQQGDRPQAALQRVLVYRGQPSPDHDSKGYGRNQAQKAQWERDKRVLVTLRPLKYDYQRARDGRPAKDSAGNKIIVAGPREKGVDVLCALAAVREAQNPSTGLVILASSDTDLAPVLDEVRRLGTAKIETFCWWDSKTKRGYQLHPVDRSRPVWNTRLLDAAFIACRDLTDYA